MKKFLVILSFLGIPFLGLVIYLLQMPVDKAFGYSFTNNVDCNTSWIYYRIFENENPVDIAFIGTSHTGCGINDSLLTRKLSEGSRPIQVANLAYCTKGRNMQKAVMKDLLEQKKSPYYNCRGTHRRKREWT